MKKYIEVMEHIYPTEVQRKQMLERAFAGTVKRRRFRLGYCLAAAALCALFSTVVFADEIKNTFYGIFSNDNIVGEQVLSDVYTDSDEHVRISVKEVLSDKITAYAIVEYTALDERGKKWLDDFYAERALNALKLNPLIKDNNAALYGVSYSYRLDELEQYRSENTHVFMVMYESSGEHFGTDSVLLYYPMTNKWENTAAIDVSESVEVTDIKIDSSQAPDKYYKPMGVKLSPMSILIYGKNCGMVESGKTESGGYYEKIVNYDEIDSLYLIMKDGTIYNMLSLESESTDMVQAGFMQTFSSNPEVEYDCVIYTGTFKETMDISLIDGIKLDGVFYPLK